MAFSAPALFTTISPTLYESQLNSNATKIQSALNEIQTELAALTGVGLTGAQNNLVWVDEALGIPRGTNAGVIGKRSFFPTFTETTDGWILTITHPRGKSQAILGGLLHRHEAALSYNVSLLAGVEESQRFVFGVTTAGVPALTPVLEQSSGETDDTSAMNIWEFTFLRTTDGEKIVDLQRACPLLVDRELLTELADETEALQISIAGTVGASVGLSGIPAIIPFDCEIVSVSAWLGTDPDTTDGRGLEFQVLLNGEEEIHDGLFQFGNQTDADSAGTVATAAGLVNPVQAREDESLRLNFLDADPLDGAADLLVQIQVRRLYHEVRRRNDL